MAYLGVWVMKHPGKDISGLFQLSWGEAPDMVNVIL